MIRDDKWHPTKPEAPDFKCRECGSDQVEYNVWSSSCGGYDDIQYRCPCGRNWWVEGSDA